MVAARSGPVLGVPIGRSPSLDRRGALGPPLGGRHVRGRARDAAPRLPRPPALRADLPVDLAFDQLLDLVDRPLIGARDDGQRRPDLPARPVRPMRCT